MLPRQKGRPDKGGDVDTQVPGQRAVLEEAHPRNVLSLGGASGCSVAPHESCFIGLMFGVSGMTARA